MIDRTGNLGDVKTGTAHAEHWRTLYFTRNGRPYWSWFVRDTEAEARAASAEFFADCAVWVADGGDPDSLVKTWSGHLIPMCEFSHAIPMPWRPD